MVFFHDLAPESADKKTTMATEEPAFVHGACEAKGLLIKKWKRTWIIVKRGLMQYFQTDSIPTKDDKQLDTVRLRGCSIRRCEKKETKRDFSFCIVIPKGALARCTGRAPRQLCRCSL